jgi:hypothetical protein
VVGLTAAGQERADDLGVEHGAARCDTPHRFDELGNFSDPVLEEVADRARVCGQELTGIALLDELGEDEQWDRWPAPPDLDCRPQALVPVAGRHADVDDGQVGLACFHRIPAGTRHRQHQRQPRCGPLLADG